MKRHTGKELYDIDGNMMTMAEALKRYECCCSTFRKYRDANKLHELPKMRRTSTNQLKDRLYLIKGEMITEVDAAIKYNTTVPRVQMLIRLGQTDFIDKPQPPGPKPGPITVRGIRFETRKECAKHNKMHYKTVDIYVSKGKIDQIGMHTNPYYGQELADYYKRKNCN